MTRHEDPDAIRAALEERVLREVDELWDSLETDDGTRREVAAQVVESARKDAVNSTAAAWTQALERRLGPEKRALREWMIEEGLVKRTPADDQWKAGKELFDRATELLEAKEHDRAAALYEQALTIVRKLGNEYSVGTCLLNLSLIDIHRRDSAAARRRLEEAAEIHHRLGHQAEAAGAMSRLGDLAIQRGDREAARSWWGKALTRYTNAGKRHEEPAQLVIKALDALD